MATPGTLNISYRDQSGKLVSASIADFGQYPIWSTAVFATNQSSPLTLFQQPVGGTKPGASTVTNTRLDTNMTTTGQLDAFGEMLVYALRIFITQSQGNATPTITNLPIADLNQIISQTYQSLTTSTEKPLLEGGVADFPAGGGIYGTTTQNTAESWNNGSPEATAGRVLASPIYLPGLTGFRVTAQFMPAGFSTLATNREVRYTLDGLRKKAVQ